MTERRLMERLMATLDREGEVPLSAQFVREVWLEVADGVMVAGDRLPTVRETAIALQMTPRVVERAYAELDRLGVTVTRPGQGTFVSASPPPETERRQREALNPILENAVREARAIGVPGKELRGAPEEFLEGTDPPGVRTLELRRLGRVPYAEGLRLQDELVALRRAERIPDQLLLLEHPHVITEGSATSPDHVLADADRLAELGVERFETGRGGDVTYHGPGQLVGYPILSLAPDRKDLHRYLRDLEAVLLGVLEGFGIQGERARGFTGVWTDQGKVAAIGVRVSSGWITSHGFALNVSTDLAFFETIVPCGLSDRRVTSLERLLGEAVPMRTVEDRVAARFGELFGRRVEEAGPLPDPATPAAAPLR